MEWITEAGFELEHETKDRKVYKLVPITTIAVYFLWRCEVIKADHEGDCPGAQNLDNIEHKNLLFRYNIKNEQQFELLKYLYHRFLTNNRFIKIIRPKIKNIEIPGYKIRGSNSDSEGYYECYSSNEGLRHEKQITPLEPLKFITVRDKSIKFKQSENYQLVKFLDKMIIINDILKNILPEEIINIICELSI